METSNEYSRGVIKGIYGYLREHDGWDVHLGEYGRGEPSPEWLVSWEGDGIIARIENEEIASLVRLSGIPAVDTSSGNFVAGIPWVETDDRKIAEMAFSHLRHCGLTRFGFVGAHFNWSRWRAAHFREILEAEGLPGHFYHTMIDLRKNVVEAQRHMESWLQNVPKPIGIFAAYDHLGRLVIDSCHRAGCIVPEEVAVIGVDNDPLICELCAPPLTSIMPDTFLTGYRAASLLDRLMNGEAHIPLTHRIAPIGVRKRRSTDSLGIEDPHISKALHYIHEHASERAIDMSEILAFTPMTRRVFEKRFRALVGRSPHKESQRIRVNRIKQLLRETDLGLWEIGEKTGFEHLSYMSYLFKRETGLTPLAYRDKGKG